MRIHLRYLRRSGYANIIYEKVEKVERMWKHIISEVACTVQRILTCNYNRAQEKGE